MLKNMSKKILIALLGVSLFPAVAMSIPQPSINKTINSIIMEQYSERAYSEAKIEHVYPIDIISMELYNELYSEIKDNAILINKTTEDSISITLSSDYSFDINNDKFNEHLIPVLKAMKDTLLRHSNAYIVVISHTDDVGPQGYNSILSIARANHVAYWLIEQGLSPKQIKTSSYGEDYPRIGNLMGVNRKYNRRVDFVIINK